MFGPINLVLDLLWRRADTESHALGFAVAYPRVCRHKQCSNESDETQAEFF